MTDRERSVKYIVPEGWILADRNACLEHLGFRAADIPQNFDVLTDAKLKLLTAARRASKAGVREGLVAVSKSGSLAEGDTYNAILTQFVTHNWRPRYAERSSVSLKKARVRLAELAARAGIR